MARRNSSLKPQLNQIRTWVAEGVTDIWIAHQLDTTPAEVSAFRRQQGLLRPDEAAAAPAAPKPRRARASTATTPRTRTPKAVVDESAPVESGEDEPSADASSDDGEAPAKRRRRGRRGGRGRGRSRIDTIAATLARDDQGVTIHIDAAVLELNVFREHWLELTNGVITVTADGITLAAVPPETDDEPTDDDQPVAADESEPATA